MGVCLAICASALIAACSGGSGAETGASDPDGGAATTREALLPHEPGVNAPSFARVADGETIDVERVANVTACEGCHADVAAQWRTSAHSFASFNNPYYRASVDRVRREAGLRASKHCAGCHDVTLLFSGAMDREVEASDPRSHNGLPCLVCHSIERATLDGNGSYVLTGRPVPIPERRSDGSYDAASIDAHKRRVAMPALRTAELCGSCHRAFLGPDTGNPHHILGQDDVGQWLASAYAGSRGALLDDPVEPRTCRGCHMAPEPAVLGDKAATDGRVASHRWIGAHTTLAAMRGDAQSIERIADHLESALTIDVAAANVGGARPRLPADGAPIEAGEDVALDVVLRNVGSGHRFPGGTRDAQDTWIELTVHDARGRLVAESGARHASGDDDDAEVHRLRVVQLDEAGQPALERDVHRFRTSVYDHTILPRDATVVRYALSVPRDLDAGSLPLRVDAKVRHRRHLLTMERAACAATRSERGQAFAGATRALGLPALDGCATQPVIEIARTVAWLGGDAPGDVAGPAPRPLWRRMFDHALGLSHGLQERLDDARPSLALALAELERDAASPPLAQAEVLALLARIEVRQNRLDRALETIARAEALAPGHPALARLRGDAYAAVWRWPEAAVAYAEAAPAAPYDEDAWRALALARGSAGDDAGALEAARRGLELQERDEALLRVQSLSLHSPREAQEAFLRFRRPDDAPRLKAMCSRTVPGCARERIPVHVHELRGIGAWRFTD